MSNTLDTLRASARAEVLRLVAEHDGRPWRGMGRYTRPRCGECGYESRPLSTECALCGEVLHEGS